MNLQDCENSLNQVVGWDDSKDNYERRDRLKRTVSTDNIFTRFVDSFASQGNGISPGWFWITTICYASLIVAVPLLISGTWTVAVITTLGTLTMVVAHCLPAPRIISWSYALIFFVIFACVAFGIEMAIANRFLEGFFYAVAIVFSVIGNGIISSEGDPILNRMSNLTYKLPY